MKKLSTFTLTAVMALSLAACGNSAGSTESSTAVSSTESSTAAESAVSSTNAGGSNEGAETLEEKTPDTVVVTGFNGSSEEVQVEVPYDPQRVVVVDYANLDILDNLGLGDRVVGVPGISLDYLKSYAEKDGVAVVGTVKTPDLEAIMACEPDVIFMAGRAAEYYDDLCEIAPVVRLISDTDLGLVETVRKNAALIASIFGEEDQVDALLTQYDSRIAALAEKAEGKTTLLGMCTTGSFNLLGNDGRCSLIVNEIGFENIGAEAATTGGSERGGDGGHSSGGERGSSAEGAEGADSAGRSKNHGSDTEETKGAGASERNSGSTPTHGNEASFELVVDLDPDYIFVMDRDAAIGTNGAQLAQEIMENELVMSTRAYQDGHLVILEHSGIWYTAEGGITALGIMLDDLETALQ